MSVPWHHILRHALASGGGWNGSDKLAEVEALSKDTSGEKETEIDAEDPLWRWRCSGILLW